MTCFPSNGKNYNLFISIPSSKCLLAMLESLMTCSINGKQNSKGLSRRQMKGFFFVFFALLSSFSCWQRCEDYKILMESINIELIEKFRLSLAQKSFVGSFDDFFRTSLSFFHKFKRRKIRFSYQLPSFVPFQVLFHFHQKSIKTHSSPHLHNKCIRFSLMQTIGSSKNPFHSDDHQTDEEFEKY